MSYFLLGILTAISGSMLYPLLKNGFAWNKEKTPAVEKRSCDVLQCRQHHYPSCVAHVQCDDNGELVASKNFEQGDALIHCPRDYIFEANDVVSLAEKLIDAHEPQHRATCWHGDVLEQSYMFWPETYQAAWMSVVGKDWMMHSVELAMRKPKIDEKDRAMALAMILAFGMDAGNGAIRIVPLLPLLDHEPDIRRVNTRAARGGDGGTLLAAKPGVKGFALKGFLGPHGGLQLLARHGRIDLNQTFGPPLKASVQSTQKDLNLSKQDVDTAFQTLADVGCPKARILNPMLQYKEVSGFAAKTVDCRVKLLTEFVTQAASNFNPDAGRTATVILSAPIYRRVYWDLGMACMNVRELYQKSLADADDLVSASSGSVGAWINRFATEELGLLDRCENAFREKLSNLNHTLSKDTPPSLASLIPELNQPESDLADNIESVIEEFEPYPSHGRDRGVAAKRSSYSKSNSYSQRKEKERAEAEKKESEGSIRNKKRNRPGPKGFDGSATAVSDGDDNDEGAIPRVSLQKLDRVSFDEDSKAAAEEGQVPKRGLGVTSTPDDATPGVRLKRHPGLSKDDVEFWQWPGSVEAAKEILNIKDNVKVQERGFE